MILRALKPLPVLAVCLLSISGHGSATRFGDVSKLDILLRQAVHQGIPDDLSVIVQVVPGAQASIRKRLADHGHLSYADHPTIDAFSVRIHLGDLRELTRDPHVVAVSTDARVGADQLIENTFS